MPSLSALKEFKASFDNISHQKANLEAKEIPFDDLELPDSEPVPLATDTGNFDSDDFAAAEAEADAMEFEDASGDDIDFSAFLDIPDDPSLAAGSMIPDEGTAADSTENGPDNLDDFTLPEPPAAGGSLDLDSLDNFDLPEEPLAAASDKSSLDGFDDFSLLDEPLAAAGDESSPGDFDDLGLPDEPAAAAGGESGIGSFDDFNLPNIPADADSDDNFDLENLDNLDNLGLPDESMAAGGDDNFDLNNLDNLGDFGLPEEPPAVDSDDNFDLENLDNLGDLGIPDESMAAGGDDNFDMDNLDNLDGFGLPEEPPATDSDDNFDLENLDNLGDLSLPDESTAAGGDDNFDLNNLDNLGDLSLPDEPMAAGDDASGPDNLDDFGLPEEPPAEVGDESIGLDSFGDLGLSDESMAAGNDASGLDAPDDFTMPDDAAAADEDAIPDNADVPHEPAPDGFDDFSFPELDNVLKKSEQKTPFAGAGKAPAKGKRRGKEKKARTESPVPEDVEEIHLSEYEVEGLQETLSRYPLNLRIACEEIIAEHFVEPKQMAELIEHLVWGATAKETAELASKILGRSITVPKAFEKSTGAALEAEQASFSYIFVHNFLPVLRLFMFIALVAASLFYLIFKFVYTPLKAERIYEIGYERIFAGEYQRANERFNEAFAVQRKKDWFYKYAEAFRDERQFIYAEQKYDELLRNYPRDKKGILDYAGLETHHLRNYAKADNILRWQLLDFAPNDREGLIAAGDNSLIWGEVDPAKFEDARYYYARLMEKYGWEAPIVERMMKYFIRTDNLREVLPLKNWFDNNPQANLSPESLGELGGYLLDKQLEEARGVPNEHIEYIGSVREMLLEAVYADPSLPEPHYHLARYYQSLGSEHEERVTLRVANRAFDDAPEGSIRRVSYRIDALQRYADSLIKAREFIPAEEQLVKGINLYEDAVSRRLLSHAPKFGRLYGVLGDLEYFTKTGDMEAALRFYHRSEQHGWAPPEMQYRMGSAYYQREDWKNALEYLFAASSSLPLNRRILFAMGNTALKRGDYFAANGYYNRLLDMLEGQRSRLPVLLPNDRPDYLELAERLMMAHNNAGVACEMLAAQTGNRAYHTRALAFYAEAQRAWDSRTRDPRTMIRSGSTPLPFLNSRNTLYPQPGYEPQIFIRIDREALESSPWNDITL